MAARLNETFMADIFISYAKEDREKAGELARLLEQRQWTVWWDREIAIGLSFDEVIEREILAGSCVIVLWTAHAVGSKWVRREARSAAHREVLVPILAENVALPLEFTDLQAADLTAWDHIADHPEFEKVVRRIEALVPRAAGTLTPGRPAATRGDRPAAAVQPAASSSRRVVRTAAWPPGAPPAPGPDSDRTRTAPVHEDVARSSWIASHPLGSIAIALIVVGGLAGGGFYLSTRSAPSSTIAQDPKIQNPNVAPPDLPKTSEPEPRPAAPQRRTNDLGFQLSIDQVGSFTFKEFAIDGLDLGRDFLLDFDIKSTRPGGSTRYGIAWNFQRDDFLLFTLHSIDFGYYSIGPGNSRQYTSYSRFSEGKININAEQDFDVIRLRKRGDELTFSVNAQDVWNTTDYRLRSNRFAFWAADRSDAVIKSYAVQQ